MVDMAWGKQELIWDTTNLMWTTTYNEISQLRADLIALNTGKRRRHVKAIDWQTLNPFRS